MDRQKVNEAKFTKGPWTLETVKTQVGHCHKIGPFPTNNVAKPETFACVYVDGLGMRPEHSPELLANARLIAAAPDLYDALKTMLEASCEHPNCGACNKAKAALAKANLAPPEGQ